MKKNRELNSKLDLSISSPSESMFKTHSFQGTNWTILFLIVPVASIAWAIIDKVKLPMDELAYLITATKIGFFSFAPLWMLSFFRTHRDKNLFLITVFLLFLWLLSCFFLIAKLNIVLDQSPIVRERSKVSRAVSVAGGKNSRGHCVAYLTSPINKMEKITLKKTYCEDLTNGKNGIEVHYRAGAINLPYMVDSMILKDFDIYVERIK